MKSKKIDDHDDLYSDFEKIIELAASPSTLEDFCDSIAEAIHNPVALTLPTRTIIARSKDYDDRLASEYTNANMLMSDAEFEDIQDNIAKRFRTGKPTMERWDYAVHKHLNCGCLYGGTFVAVLDSPITNELPSENAMRLFELYAKAAVLILKQKGFIIREALTPMQIFLLAMLKGNYSFDYQWKFRKHYIFTGSFTGRIAWLEERQTESPLTAMQVLNDFCDKNPNTNWSVPLEEGYVMLLDDKEYGKDGRILNKLLQRFDICISDPFTDLKEMKKNLELVQMSLHLAKRGTNACSDPNDENRPSFGETASLITVDSYKPLIAYFYAYSHSDLDIFTSECLEMVIRHDQTYNTDFMETIRVLIHHNLKTEKVAAALKIQKSTVFYRIKKLNELFHIDFKDIRTLVGLYLNLSLMYHNK